MSAPNDPAPGVTLLQVLDPDPHPIVVFPNAGNAMEVYSRDGVMLLAAAVADGRWTATYRPEDLDEAVRRFVDAVALLLGQTLSVDVPR